jgi:hypothetical protein
MQALHVITANNNAQQAGFESGRLDAIIGHRSEYAWQCASDAPGYSHFYGIGYRLGWREAQRKGTK